MQVLFCFNGVEEEVKAGTFGLGNEQRVDILEEFALALLQFLVIHFAVDFPGDGVKIGHQVVKRVAALLNIGVEQTDRLLFSGFKSAEELRILFRAERVHILGGADLKPVACQFQTGEELLFGVR